MRCLEYWSRDVLRNFIPIQVLYGNVPWDTNQSMKSFQLSLKKPIDFPNTVPLSAKMKNLISKMLIFKDEERINIKDVKLIIDEMLNYGWLILTSSYCIQLNKSYIIKWPAKFNRIFCTKLYWLEIQGLANPISYYASLIITLKITTDKPSALISPTNSHLSKEKRFKCKFGILHHYQDIEISEISVIDGLLRL